MSHPQTITKSPQQWPVTPNLLDYQAACRDFDWEEARRVLQGLPGGGLNMAFEAVDRHARGPLAQRTAFRFLDANGAQDMSYAELAGQTNRFANELGHLGVGAGEHLFVLAGRVPALYTAVLGSLKCGVVVTPLFSAFGPEPIATRVNLGRAAVLVTTPSLYQRKVAPIRDRLPTLRHVLLIPEDGPAKGSAKDSADGTLPAPAPLPPATHDLAALMASASEQFEVVPTRPDSPALLHFTSGTTGTPKGALHVHGAALTHWVTGRDALDLHGGDIFWCTADPGWVTGTSYGILAPLLHGVTSIVDAADFDAQRWYRILHEQKVSVWYTAPTAIRMLMKAGPELAHQHRYPDLRMVASVGEPLNPEAVWWGLQTLGLPIHDNWWQTETGGIMVANLLALPIKPGSMGVPLPGVQAAIVHRREDGGLTVVEAPDVEGELALKRGWPSMFVGYLDNPQRYAECFVGDWYLSGDLARRDADGYYWFVGRSSDVIKSAGHLIGPFEVENALMEHPAVAEAGVIGKPDATVGEVVKAFVSLKAGFEPGEALRLALLGHARKKLGASIAPKEIDFLDMLPRTRSGKIMRRLLKARELGLPEGDTSTLEGGA